MGKSKGKIVKKIGLFFIFILFFCMNVNAEGENQEEIIKDAGTEYVSNVLTIEQCGNMEYKAVLSNVVLPEGTQSIKVPIWSGVNGQDDIKWYTAQKQNDGTYTVTFSLLNHKGLGEYNIHTYALTNSGNYVFLSKTNVSVAEPAIQNVLISDYNINAGTFRVVLDGLSNVDKVKSIQIPIWSSSNGQDDIIWYSAKKDSQGNYYVDVNIKNHKYSVGAYNVHVYVTDVTGYRFFAGSTQHNIAVENGNLIVKKNNEKEYTIQLNDALVPGGAAQIQFPVWSKVNGQDDIKWYTAKKDSNGNYSCKISITNHKGLGQFIVHAYAKMPNNSMIYMGASGFETESPSIENIEATITNKSSGQFQIRISNIQNDGLIKKIQVPIWSTSNQSDIVWYTATRNSDGDYIVDVNISKHQYHCSKYNIHVYLTDITGCMQFVGSTVCDMRPEYKGFIAEDINNDETVFRVTLTDLQVPGGLKNVRFAVWGSSGGQNDIQWYTATKESDGSYTYDIKVKNHKELGKYNVHAYCTTFGNSLQFIGSTEYEVVNKPTAALLQISYINGTTGTFKITVSGVMASSGVEKVQIPVWCADNQSDIVWYTATKISEGVYTVTAKVSNHAHHFGTYKVHVYVTMGNGIRAFTCSDTATIQALNYVYTRSLSSTRQEVGIMGVANATKVQFPTWSNTNGQDDIVWYSGTNQGNGNWNVIVDSAKHNSGGTYTTHVYATVNGSLTMVGETTYSLSKVPTVMSQMLLKANIYSSSTPYLILVNRSTHKVAVFQGRQGNWNCIQFWDCADGAPSSPTVEGTFRVGSRGYYFDSGASRCYWYTQFYGNYLFHSVLYNKNGTLQDGRVGMALSHGCVRLQIQNAKWIYDTIPSGTTVVVYH